MRRVRRFNSYLLLYPDQKTGQICRTVAEQRRRTGCSADCSAEQNFDLQNRFCPRTAIRVLIILRLSLIKRTAVDSRKDSDFLVDFGHQPAWDDQ